MDFIIEGVPIAKQRHRTTKKGHTYDPQVKEALETKRILTDIIFHNSFCNEPLTGSLRLDIVFHFGRTKSHYGTGRNSQVLKQDAPELYAKKPDIDNLIKFYMDCMTGIVYKDDCQVISICSRKHYTFNDERPRTWIKISEFITGEE